MGRMSSDTAHAKRALRAELRERRRILPRSERDEARDALTRQLIALTQTLGARSLSCYLSTPDEPDTRSFLRWACESGVRVLVPVSRADGLLDWALFTDADEIEDAQGMPAPDGEVLGPIAVGDVDLMLVPAAAVDDSGMRMGWGRGYFDKTLGSMDRRPPVFAVVFDHEVVDSLPAETHDQGVDGVVTPGGIRRFDR